MKGFKVFVQLYKCFSLLRNAHKNPINSFMFSLFFFSTHINRLNTHKCQLSQKKGEFATYADIFVVSSCHTISYWKKRPHWTKTAIYSSLIIKEICSLSSLRRKHAKGNWKCQSIVNQQHNNLYGICMVEIFINFRKIN